MLHASHITPVRQHDSQQLHRVWRNHWCIKDQAVACRTPLECVYHKFSLLSCYQRTSKYLNIFQYSTDVLNNPASNRPECGYSVLIVVQLTVRLHHLGVCIIHSRGQGYYHRMKVVRIICSIWGCLFHGVYGWICSKHRQDGILQEMNIFLIQ